MHIKAIKWSMKCSWVIKQIILSTKRWLTAYNSLYLSRGSILGKSLRYRNNWKNNFGYDHMGSQTLFDENKVEYGDSYFLPNQFAQTICLKCTARKNCFEDLSVLTLWSWNVFRRRGLRRLVKMGAEAKTFIFAYPFCCVRNVTCQNC